MNFTLPEARRERMDQLLEYLGDTSRYSKYYDGNRAEDFKKCFDIESGWCWKYADLVLRGLEKRELEYAEGHHIVPASFYGKRYCSKVDDGNLTTLTYGEHLLSHYCLVFCSTGKMRGKMAGAFLVMYRIGMAGSRPLMPTEAELLNAIPEMELKRIQAMETKWVKVEAEGRTHYSEDPVQYKKDYREVNKEKFRERDKAYREVNKEKIAERSKAYYEANRDKRREYGKAWREANKVKIAERMKVYWGENKEKITERKKVYREANREKIAEQKKAYREVNKEKIAERSKAYREANREKIVERRKAYWEDNKEKITERKKVYREANREKIAEYMKSYWEDNKEKITEYRKAYYEANKDKHAEQMKAYYEAKKAAGYRYRKNPLTGKQEWVFVGLPEQEVAA